MIAKRSAHAPFAEPERLSQDRFVRRIVILFVVAGLAWVLITDTLLYAFVRSQPLIARIETAKGWGFVFLAALFLTFVTRRSIARFTRERATMDAVVESIGDGLLILGANRAVEYANPAALRMLNCERPSDVVGVDGKAFVRKYRVEWLNGSIVPADQLVSQRVFDEGGPLTHKIIIRPPGAPDVVVTATAAAVRARPQDRAELVVSVMHDVTAEHSLEQLRGKLYAATAHSLKTPVAIIKSHAQLLARTGGAPPHVTTAVVRQCDRINRLVQNILVMNRVDTGSLELHTTDLDLAPVVARVARDMGQASPRHSVNVETDSDVRVRGDFERLGILVGDLIDVALRSSVHDSTVTVRLRRADGHAEIGVRYRPLPAEDRMDPAYEEFDDLGVSRRVAVALAAAHGGCIWEEPSGGEITTWVRLPALNGQHAERA